MSEIKNISIDKIDPNPWRNLTKHPYNEDKLETLRRSIDDVGFWEGVIARPVGRRYELAFGHHRLEAARRQRLTRIPVVVRELTDEQMVQFMGRENQEEFSVDFLGMYHAWDGAREFLKNHHGHDHEPQTVEIAKLLGWTHKRSDGKQAVRLSMAAEACNAASVLLEEHKPAIRKEYFKDVSIYAVGRATQRARARINQARRAKKMNPRINLESRIEKNLGALKIAVAAVRDGDIKPNQVAAEVDRLSGLKDARSPALDHYLGYAIKQVAKIGSSDTGTGRIKHVMAQIGAAGSRRTPMEVDKETQALLEKASVALGDAIDRLVALQTAFDKAFDLIEETVIDISEPRKALGA